MPNNTGRFHLYSDTSKFATGSALCQIQSGKPKLIAYTRKRLPKAARNYSITEIELYGLASNIASFSHLLKRVDFDAVVDHLALTHIIKNKAKPATTRIKRLLEIISSYSFNLYYIKGKDMKLGDFLSRQRHNDSNPHEITPISFNMHQVLQEKYYNLEQERYLVQTCSQTKVSGITLPEVHGIGESLDPNKLPEKQNIKSQVANDMQNEILKMKTRLGQGRAGIRCRKIPNSQPMTQSVRSNEKHMVPSRHSGQIAPNTPKGIPSSKIPE